MPSWFNLSFFYGICICSVALFCLYGHDNIKTQITQVTFKFKSKERPRLNVNVIKNQYQWTGIKAKIAYVNPFQGQDISWNLSL